MKLVGEGTFTNREDRQAAMKFAFNIAGVDSATVGYKNIAEDAGIGFWSCGALAPCV